MQTYWIIVFPKRWVSVRSSGWIYEIQTLSHTRKEAIEKCEKDFKNLPGYNWKKAYKDGRRCIKVTLQELV